MPASPSKTAGTIKYASQSIASKHFEELRAEDFSGSTVQRTLLLILTDLGCLRFDSSVLDEMDDAPQNGPW